MGELLGLPLLILADMLVAMLSFLLQIVIALIANLLGASWLALHYRGLQRIGFGIIALTSAHLLAGILLPVTGTAPLVLLSWTFSPWTMGLSLGFLLIGALLILAAREGAPAGPEVPETPKPADTISVIAAKELVSYGMAILLGGALLIGAFAVFTAQSERRTLREALCDAATARISNTWKDRGRSALDLTERLLKRDLDSKLPCPPPQD